MTKDTVAQPVDHTVEHDAECLFRLWNDSLATQDPWVVTSCYGSGAVLLPTLSNQVRTNPAAIQDYFKHFLARQPQGVIKQCHARKLADGLLINSGIYTFNFGDGSHSDARFTFVYERQEDGWKIIEHHSSPMPENI